MSQLGEATTRFQESLRAIATHDTPASSFELHRARFAVWHLVDVLKALGESEQYTLAFAQYLAVDAGVQPATHAVAGCLVPWCIERYRSPSRRSGRGRLRFGAHTG